LVFFFVATINGALNGKGHCFSLERNNRTTAITITIKKVWSSEVGIAHVGGGTMYPCDQNPEKRTPEKHIYRISRTFEVGIVYIARMNSTEIGANTA